MDRILKEWQAFADRCLEPVTPAESEQMRVVFYSGVAAMFYLTLEIAKVTKGKEPEEAVKEFREIEMELLRTAATASAKSKHL